jgi:putative NIF3 family GTP cyclohydrolase 1 type 2
MKLGGFYQRVISLGKASDPRGPDAVERYLAEKKEAFEKLPAEEEEFFDRESLDNPYADTRLLYGEPDQEIRKIMVGIDIGIGEILLTDRLNQKGARIDCVMAHHPLGGAAHRLDEVMEMQVDIFHGLGIPISAAEGFMSPRIKEVHRRSLPRNTAQALDAARHLDIPLMTAHTPADNMVTRYLSEKVKKAAPRRVGQVIELLREEEEYQQAAREKRGLKILVGNKSNRAGQVFIDMTGGTAPGKEIYARLAAHSDVGTVVCMHMSEESRKTMEENHMNVIIAGHIASDSLGLNLLLDRICQDDPVDILCCSAFHRVNRT